MVLTINLPPEIKLLRAIERRIELGGSKAIVLACMKRILAQEGWGRAVFSAKLLAEKAQAASNPAAWITWAASHSYPIWLTDGEHQQMKRLTLSRRRRRARENAGQWASGYDAHPVSQEVGRALRLLIQPDGPPAAP